MRLNKRTLDPIKNYRGSETNEKPKGTVNVREALQEKGVEKRTWSATKHKTSRTRRGEDFNTAKRQAQSKRRGEGNGDLRSRALITNRFTCFRKQKRNHQNKRALKKSKGARKGTCQRQSARFHSNAS